MTSLYGIDVASYQPTDLSKYAKQGAKFAFVKISQSTTYTNPNASGQIASAKKLGLKLGGYFYADFSNNSITARNESKFAVSSALRFGLPLGSIIAVDWESGSGNVTSGSATSNTQAILSAMQVIKDNGFKPMLYTGAYLAKSKINTKAIIAKYPNCLWIAQYPTMQGVRTADMSWFPSMDGVGIWQFTSNWYGQSVDANIAVVDVFSKVVSQSPTKGDYMQYQLKLSDLGRFKVNNENGAKLYKNSNFEPTGDSRKHGTVYKIFRVEKGAVNVGTNQWFALSDGVLYLNSLATNEQANGVAVVADNDCWTTNDKVKGVTKLNKGTRWQVKGRAGKWLIVGNEQTGKYINSDHVLIEVG